MIQMYKPQYFHVYFCHLFCAVVICPMQQNRELRTSLKKQRRALNSAMQKKTEVHIFHRMLQQTKFRTAQKVGLYLHAFGEVHTQKLIEYCFKQGKNVFLPMICNMNLKLVWVQITQHQYRNKRFTMHHLGMLEPMKSRGLHVSALDFLVLPLLACDQFGTRMGMGAGFYDRTLASAPKRPYRVGIAHDFQFLSTPLQRNTWDQPLDALITVSKVYRFSRHSSPFNV